MDTSLEPKTNSRFNPTLNLPDLAKPGGPGVRALVKAVQAAVGSIDESTLRPVAKRNAGLSFQPQSLLALLSYCYAREIYGSTEVESLLAQDLNFRKLCQDKFPDAAILRQFRRENRDAIQLCLEATLRFQAEQKVKEGFVTKVNGEFPAEAKRRLIMAMFIDSMDLDGE